MSTFAYRAFLIDLDGTLLDTERLYTECLLEASESLGKPLNREVVHSLTGLSAREHHEALIKHFGSDHFIDEIKEITHKDFFDKIEQRTPVKPQAKTFLEALLRRGIPFAIATNTRTDHARERIENSDIKGLTSHIYGADLVPSPKPAPDIYLHAASMLGVPQQDALAIEDSEAGVAAALASNAHVAHIPDLRTIPEDLASRCHIRADSLKSLAEILLIDF